MLVQSERTKVWRKAGKMIRKAEEKTGKAEENARRTKEEASCKLIEFSQELSIDYGAAKAQWMKQFSLTSEKAEEKLSRYWKKS